MKIGMKILVIGSVEESTPSAWRLAGASRSKKSMQRRQPRYSARGGMSFAGRLDSDHYLRLATEIGADLTVVGPEAPL
jgi:phosphoribosylamine-glycine ligase